MKLIPSSTARRSTRIASARSRGSPQTPLPVILMAPKPSLWTERSPPIRKSPESAADNLFVALFGAMPMGFDCVFILSFIFLFLSRNEPSLHSMHGFGYSKQPLCRRKIAHAAKNKKTDRKGKTDSRQAKALESLTRKAELWRILERRPQFQPQNLTMMSMSTRCSSRRRSGNHTLLPCAPQAVCAALSVNAPDVFPSLHAKNCGNPLLV